MFASVVPRLAALLGQHAVPAIAAGLISGAVVAGAGVATGIIPVGGTRVANAVALLACPGSGRVLDRIPAGQSLLITARSADGHWLQVYVGLPGVTRAWVAASALRLQSAADGLPVEDCLPTALASPPPATASPSAAPSATVTATVLPTVAAASPTPRPSATPKPKVYKIIASACGNFDGVAGCSATSADALISQLIDTNDNKVPDKGDTVRLYRYPTSFDNTASAWGTFRGTTSVKVASVVTAIDHIDVTGTDGMVYQWGRTATTENFGIFSIGSPLWEADDDLSGSSSDVIYADAKNPWGVPPENPTRAGNSDDKFVQVVLNYDRTAPVLSHLVTTGAPLNGDPSLGYWQIYGPSATCQPHSATISVTATDPDDAVKSITFHYTPFFGSADLTAPMVKVSSSLWQYVLQADDSWEAGQILYSVEAVDTHGNSATLLNDQELYNLYTATC